MYFKDRRDAGRQLCQLLQKYKQADAVVYALPRGGVVVADEIAKFLNAPLELILAHKIGHPGQPEYALAAISESGHLVGSQAKLQAVDPIWLQQEKEQEIKEIKRRRKVYMQGMKEVPVKDKVALIVDDGIATGLTMQAAIKEIKDRHPQKVVVVAPVAPKSTVSLLKREIDDFVGYEFDQFLGSVGAYYDEFYQVQDEEVIAILAKSQRQMEGSVEKIIHVGHSQGILEGMLKVPKAAKGLVLFVHGSGSSRFSPRNNFVADHLNKAGLGTLLIDLLSKQEDENTQTRFDIDLLAERLSQVVKWLQNNSETQALAIGLFGSSTGAAAALAVAAQMPAEIKAVVSRGGRPDLAMEVLGKVKAPTLLIVGENDVGVIELNEQAFARLKGIKQFEFVEKATHLFEEPGCLEEVARLAKEWFIKYLLPKKGQ